MTPAVPLHIVSGKGGTGKTTVSLALSAVLARPGAEVLVCEVEDRHSLTEATGMDDIPPGQERSLFEAGAGRVSALSVDPRHALTDYLESNFRLGLAGRILERSGFVDFATDLAPGLRDVLLVGKVYQAARRRAKGSDAAMDAVVLDAPPTGRLETFLTAGDALADLVKVGPIRGQADSIMALLRAPTTQVHLVTTPSEMATTETIQAIDAIERHRLRVGRVIVTMVHPLVPQFRGAAGLSERAATHLTERLAADRRLVDAQRIWIDAVTARLESSGLPPPVMLPLLPTEVRPHMLAHLADLLAAQAGPAGRIPDPDLIAPPPASGSRTISEPANEPGSLRAGAALGRVLDDRRTRVVVCCGTGGVGKTSVSAALALGAAERGRKVVLLTVDPAKRLATALGLDSLGAVPEPVAGTRGTGTLDALMLDMTHTFDEAVRGHSAPGKADEVLRNPFYKALSTSFSGTQDYMATEQLGQLDDEASRTGRWDLIVVDTPPSRSALDFLDAPARLDRLAEGPLMQVLAPRGPLKLLSVGVAQATKVVSLIIGGQALADLQVFATAFESVMAGFRRRADGVRRLLLSDAAAFVVVASPRRTALREATFLMERLFGEARPVRAVVVNRMTVPLRLDAGDQQALRESDPPVLAWWQRAVRTSAAERDEVAHELPTGTAPVLVPLLEAEVSDLAAVRTLAKHLTEGATDGGRAGVSSS